MPATSVQFTVASHMKAALGFFDGKEISSANVTGFCVVGPLSSFDARAVRRGASGETAQRQRTLFNNYSAFGKGVRSGQVRLSKLRDQNH